LLVTGARKVTEPKTMGESQGEVPGGQPIGRSANGLRTVSEPNPSSVSGVSDQVVGRDIAANKTAVPDWKQANPVAIERALQHALAKPSGGWFVLDATRTLKTPVRKPWRNGIVRREQMARKYVVDGVELVAWADPRNGDVTVAPAVCPHMGAHLGDGHVDASDCIVCPWHGLALPSAGSDNRSVRVPDPACRSELNPLEGLEAERRWGPPVQARVPGQGRWAPWRTHDDGVLFWVQPDPTAPDATDAPILTKRPDVHFTGVIRKEVVCEPRDVIANRLDPWHGVHFHPYAFASLEVLSNTDDALDLRVGYRVTPRHIMVVEARFDCPDPRTIVMTITGGEGVGSVVETHATPLHRSGHAEGTSTLPRTAVIEATLATSDRPGFAQALKGTVIARPMIELLAGRLWKDDALYAERTYKLRASNNRR
jgi:phenylpropionate dioxygenase-like ring-hydroxylating dioxygenase large terminal subunit